MLSRLRSPFLQVPLYMQRRNDSRWCSCPRESCRRRRSSAKVLLGFSRAKPRWLQLSLFSQMIRPLLTRAACRRPRAAPDATAGPHHHHNTTPAAAAIQLLRLPPPKQHGSRSPSSSPPVEVLTSRSCNRRAHSSAHATFSIASATPAPSIVTPSPSGSGADPGVASASRNGRPAAASGRWPLQKTRTSSCKRVGEFPEWIGQRVRSHSKLKTHSPVARSALSLGSRGAVRAAERGGWGEACGRSFRPPASRL